jgi:hypothetical protein
MLRYSQSVLGYFRLHFLQKRLIFRKKKCFYLVQKCSRHDSNQGVGENNDQDPVQCILDRCLTFGWVSSVE